MGKRFAVASMVASAIAMFAGRSANELQKSWKSPQFQGGPFKKVLVIGVAKRPEVRQMYEDAFVNELKAAGSEGVTSYAQLPDMSKATREDVKKLAAQVGADAVLVTRLVKMEKETYDFERSSRLEVCFGPEMPGTYTPEQTSSAVLAFMETRLFDVKTAEVVWIGDTRSVDPNQDLQTAARQLSAAIIKSLTQDKLID